MPKEGAKAPAFCLPAAVHAQAGQVKGELTSIEGKPVLRVWGTHYEMGYAHGYLLAPEIVAMLEDYMLGRLLEDGFRYASDNNPVWLSEEQIRAIVAPFEKGAALQEAVG